MSRQIREYSSVYQKYLNSKTKSELIDIIVRYNNLIKLMEDEQ